MMRRNDIKQEPLRSRRMVQDNTSKLKAAEVLKCLETGDRQPVGYINPDKFIQHDLNAADGVEGFETLLADLPSGSVKVNIIRLFRDGEYVFAHCEYSFPEPFVGFEILRFEEGLIVEHWDNLQETAGPNPNGHTMTDGPTEVEDLENTEENKETARGLVDDILVNRRMDKLWKYFEDGNYIQHNPAIGDGVKGLTRGFEEMENQGIKIEYDRIHFVLGEGNFVLVVSEGRISGEPAAFYDLFRIKNGRVAEHWDVVQKIPPREQWKNPNGKF